MRGSFLLLVACTHAFQQLRRPLAPHRRLQGLTLATPRPQDDSDSVPSIALFAAVPAGALILQGLYAQKLLLLVLVLKRIYIYTMAGFVVAIGGACGGGDPAALGTRLEELTRELLPEATAEDLKPIQKLDAARAAWAARRAAAQQRIDQSYRLRHSFEH